ncbi:MAG: VC0807 family protein [Nocardioides sp.]
MSSPALLEANPHHPTLPAILRRVAISVLVACVVPAALFYVVMMSLGVWPAIVVALGWSYGAILWRLVTGRRTSGLLILSALVMTGRTSLALVSDSTFLYFLQPVIGDGLVALAFGLSLVTARPMVARVAGDFYPMDHELHLRPRVRLLFRNLTALWAAIAVVKATLALWLLESTSLETFVLLKSLGVLALTGLAILATVTAAAAVARQEGLMSPAPVRVRVRD